jgi:hypothetical protein
MLKSTELIIKFLPFDKKWVFSVRKKLQKIIYKFLLHRVMALQFVSLFVITKYKKVIDIQYCFYHYTPLVTSYEDDNDMFSF